MTLIRLRGTKDPVLQLFKQIPRPPGASGRPADSQVWYWKEAGAVMGFIALPLRTSVVATAAEVAQLQRSHGVVSVTGLPAGAMPAAGLVPVVVSAGVVYRNPVAAGGVAVDGGGVGAIKPAQSALLTQTTLLIEPKQLLQLLQLKNILTHFLVGEALRGGGLTLAAESALLTAKKLLAKLNKLFQLLQKQSIITQLLFQALLRGSGFGVIMLDLAKGSELFQLLQATLPANPVQVSELAEAKVATLGFKEPALGFEAALFGFSKGQVDAPNIVVIARLAKRSGDPVIPQSGIGDRGSL